MKIKVSAPGKLMLMGEHSVVYGYPCLVTAIDKRLSLEAEVCQEKILEVQAPAVKIFSFKKNFSQLCADGDPKEIRYIECAVLNFIKKHPLNFGVKITTPEIFSLKYGLGSSSAVTVCTIKALSLLSKADLSNREIFDLSYKTILDVCGVGSGFDIAAAVYGGVLYYVIAGRKIEKITDIKIPLCVGYSGIKADTPTIVKNLKCKMKNAKIKLEIENIFKQIVLLVNKGKGAIIKKDWRLLGELFNQNQTLLSKLGVSMEKLDKMCLSAVAAGAYGAKLSGAGMGDCMIALSGSKLKAKVEKAIKNSGGEIIQIKTTNQGVRIEKPI